MCFAADTREQNASLKTCTYVIFKRTEFLIFSTSVRKNVYIALFVRLQSFQK